MRRVNPQALERVRQTLLTGPVIAEGFENLVKQLESMNYPVRSPLSVMMEYRNDDDDIQEGDYLPVITMTLVPASKPQNKNVGTSLDVSSTATQQQ